MGDMPEILHSLIAKGRAILWSSQEREGYKVRLAFDCSTLADSSNLRTGAVSAWMYDG